MRELFQMNDHELNLFIHELIMLFIRDNRPNSQISYTILRETPT